MQRYLFLQTVIIITINTFLFLLIKIQIFLINFLKKKLSKCLVIRRI